MKITPKGDGVLLTPEDSMDDQLINHWTYRLGFLISVIDVDNFFGDIAHMDLNLRLKGHRDTDPEYVNGVHCG